MAPVTWNRGPWATPQLAQQPAPQPTRPYQYILEQQRGGRPTLPPFDQGEPGGRGGRAPDPGTGFSGKMDAATSMGLGLAGFAPGPIGLGAKALSMANRAAPSTSFDMSLGLPTEADLQAETDYGGAYAGARARAERTNAIADRVAQFEGYPTATTASTLAGQISATKQGIMNSLMDAFSSLVGASATPTETPTDPFGAGLQESQDIGGGPTAGWGSGTPSTGFGAGEEASGGMGGATGTTSSDNGFGDGGGESAWKLGGMKTFRKPTRLLVGEGGEPEEAIFIPESMKQRGIQGRERQVRRGLKRAYSSLT